MTREPRSRPLPDWLRDLPAAIMIEAQGMTERSPGDDRFWRGAGAREMLGAASILFKRAAEQAERLPFPGPWTMMVDTLIYNGGAGPWAADAGPRADALDADWIMALARGIDDDARDKGTIADCAAALRHVTGFTHAQVKPLATPFARATIASAYSIALMRRACIEEEAERRLENLLAVWHSCDLLFWADHGGWPWKPLQSNPRVMFLAREMVANRMGKTVPVAGHA